MPRPDPNPTLAQRLRTLPSPASEVPNPELSPWPADMPPCGPRPQVPAAPWPADMPPCGPRPAGPAAEAVPAKEPPKPAPPPVVTLLSVAISLDPERKGYEPPPPPLSAADQARVDRLLGQVRRQLMMGRTLAAVQALEEIVAFNPGGESGYQAWLQLGRLRMANPAWTERALLALRKACALAPDRAEPLAALGEALHRSGQRIEADACFQRALELDPSVPLPGFAAPPAARIR